MGCSSCLCIVVVIVVDKAVVRSTTPLPLTWIAARRVDGLGRNHHHRTIISVSIVAIA